MCGRSARRFAACWIGSLTSLTWVHYSGTQRDGRQIKETVENLEYSTAFELRVKAYSEQFREDPIVYKVIKVLVLCSFLVAGIGWLASHGAWPSPQKGGNENVTRGLEGAAQ